MPVVVDTNVVRLAEDTTAELRDCVGNAAGALVSARDTGVVLDSARQILQEYLRNADPKKEPKAGAAFLKWVLTNLANPDRIQQVVLQRHPDRDYQAFPGADELSGFDRDDRKFVAAALSSRSSLVLGLDTDYFEYESPLHRAGLRVEYVCQAELEAIAARKGIVRVP
jgi:hypothetical protein